MSITLRTIGPKKKYIMDKSKGLGDSIEKLARLMKIKPLVDKVSATTGKDCGCKKRQESLNKKFPYKK